MKRSILLSALSALALAGCANLTPTPRADPRNPQVSVIDGRYIVVNQEPLVFGKADRDVVITWQLPADGNYRFPQDGIVVSNAGEEFVQCGQRANGLAFACVNRHAKPGRYKYTIKVLDGTKQLDPLDPWVVND